MMSSWNKFCFTGGYIETNVSLPGVNNILGLWPAIWTMGNLGRAGYGASLEGMVRHRSDPMRHHANIDARQFSGHTRMIPATWVQSPTKP